MTLRKNRYYALTMNGKTFVQKYFGENGFGHCFKDNNKATQAIFLGINRLIAANPTLLEIGK